MKYKKHMIILLAAIFLFAMATASAADLNDTAVAVEDGQLTDEIIQASENQENTIQASENQENTIQASVSATNVTVDTPTTITVTIPDNATGHVIITGNFTDNEIYVENSRFSSGVATVDVSGLAEGTYSVHIKYYGLDADPYPTVENDTTFKVSKVAATGIKVDAHDTVYGKAALIEVTVPNADMTGTISLKLNDAVGTHITLSIYENKVTWNVTGLAAGKYTVYANYTGNYKYNVNDTLSKTFQVRKVTPSLTIDDAFTDAITGAEIFVHINKTATGSITIIVEAKPYTQPIKDGVATFTINVLPAGDYDISAFYNPGEDKNYTGGFNTNIKGLHVTNIVLDVENITYGDVETVTVYINKTGNVTLKLNGETYDAKDISGGKVVFPIEGLSAGNYTVEAIYTDPSGNVTSSKATFTVEKANPNLSVENQVITYGENATIALNYNTNATGKVNITLTGKKGTITYQNLDLNVTIVLPDNIPADEYNVTVSYSGDENFMNATANATLTVNKASTEITVNPASLELFVGDETVIFANLTPDGAGNVTFTSSNDTIVDVDNQGNVIAQGKGQAIITVSFAGDNNYAAAENRTITVTVSLDNASVTVVNDTLDLKIGETYAINATKHPDTIMLDITYTSSNNAVATVDGKGIVTAVGEGTAIITVEVGDDEIYAKNSTNVTVTVSKVPTEIDAKSITATYNINRDLVITLKDADGNPLAGVEISVDLNGAKTYTTDTNGQAKVSTLGLSPKTYTAKINFEGNTTYNGSSAEVKVVINKASPIIVAKKKTYKVKAKTKKFTITLKDNTGKPIKNAKVRLMVKKVAKKSKKKSSKKKSKSDKKKNYAKTNSNGKATFKVLKTKKGKYNAKVKFYGDQYYNKATKTVKIVIK